MIALLIETHMCICAICDVITIDDFSTFAQYKYFENKLSQLRRENALSSLKLHHDHNFVVESSFRQSYINFDNENDDDFDSNNEIEFVVANVSNKNAINATINIAKFDAVADQNDDSISKKNEFIIATTMKKHVVKNDNVSEKIIAVVQNDNLINKKVEFIIAIFLNENVVEKKIVIEKIVIDVENENLIDNEIDSVIAILFVEKNVDVNSQQIVI